MALQYLSHKEKEDKEGGKKMTNMAVLSVVVNVSVQVWSSLLIPSTDILTNSLCMLH